MTGLRDFGLSANDITHNSLLSGLDRAHVWDHALINLQDMQEASILPDEITYTAIIRACANAGMNKLGDDSSHHEGSKWVVVLALLEEMCSRHLQPNAITCSSSLQACMRGARPACVPELCEQ